MFKSRSIPKSLVDSESQMSFIQNLTEEPLAFSYNLVTSPRNPKTSDGVLWITEEPYFLKEKGRSKCETRWILYKVENNSLLVLVLRVFYIVNNPII